MPKITTDQLALMVQAGFAQVHEQFQQVNEHLDRHTSAIDGIKTDVRTISHKLEVVQEDLGALTTLVNDRSGAVSRLTRRLDDVQERVTTVEKHTGLQ